MLALVAAPSEPSAIALREADEPTPRPDEALVEVRAMSLNRGEVRRLPDREEGFVPGWDLAGVVARPAQDGGPPEGARVVGLVRSGAWAERACVPADLLAELPDEVSFEAASTLPVAGLTALRALARGGLLLGRRVAVTGASGGVGRFAVQLAARGGAHVTGVVGSRERGEELEALGAEEVVVGLEAEGPGFDVVLESVGGATLGAAIARIAPAGTIVSFGNTSGEETTVSASALYGQAPGARVYGLFVFDEVAREQSGPRDLATLAALVARGELDPQIDLEASWHDAAEAVEALLERRLRGKAVLRVEAA